MEHDAGRSGAGITYCINVSSHLTRMAAEHAGETAIHYPAGAGPGGRIRYRSLTWRDLESDSNIIARGLLAYGLAPGSRTALMVTPSPDFFALTFALLKSGIIPVMVDPGMGAAKLKGCFAEAAPAGFIGIPKAHLARILLGWSRSTIRKIVTVFPKGPFRWGVTLDRIRAMGSDTPFFYPSPPGNAGSTPSDRPAAINFTSGSTGVPKGVVYTHGIFSSQVDLIRDTYGIEPGEIDLCTFPLFALFAPALGMTAVIPQMDFTRPAAVHPPNIIQAMEDFNPTNMFGSPALLNAVGRYCLPRKITFPSLRRVICAGAPINPAILRRFTPLLTGEARVHSGYGATEAMPLSSIDSRTILEDTFRGTESGGGVCVGTANRGIELALIRVSDDPIETWSDALKLPAGSIGEIVAHGPVVTQSYYNRDSADRLAKIFDPAAGRYRHRMGDVGRFDESGLLWFCGRKSHRVRTAGGDLYTVPVEGVFNAHPAVNRTALVGLGDPGTEIPVLCVELETGPSDVSTDTSGRETSNRIDPRDSHAVRDLFRELRRTALRYSHTQSIRRFILHRSFPVDIRHNSKIFRENLRDWVEHHRKDIVVFDPEDQTP